MNLQSMKRKAVPLHAEVAEVLRHQIMSGDLSPGARLPALSELTQELGVARMTVIQAMNSLEKEGLIEKHAGRGTFVRDVKLPDRHTLHMKADLSQIHAMVQQLEVSVQKGEATLEVGRDGKFYRCMRRIHTRDGAPFCQVDIRLDNEIYEQAQSRFMQEIVVTVLKDLDVTVAKASQKITISYADFNLAQSLGIKVNSAVFRVRREFADASGQLIYSADLVYPGDQLELEIEFSTDMQTT